MKRFLLLFTTTFLLLGCRKDDSTTITPPPPGPEVVKTGDFAVFSMPLIKDRVAFSTVAEGRESKPGAGDNPKLTLTDSGFGHPSIINIPEGFQGYKFWCAMTPYFGIVMQQPDYMAYENPHIFYSNDGVNWQQPTDVNPIDTPISHIYNPYWSDVNLVYDNNKLYLYYRGNSLPPGFFGDKKIHHRAVVVRSSSNGVDWTDRKLLYSSAITKGIDAKSLIVSPAFVKNSESEWLCYDIVYSTTDNPIPSGGNQSQAFLMRRKGNAPDGTFEDYSSDKVCSFVNRPWGPDYDPWHIDMVKYDNTYFLLVCAGAVGKSHGDALYLAYSKDGISFKVIETPLFDKDTYKSTIVPISFDKDQVKFKLYRSVKTKGTIELYDLTLHKL